MTQVMTMLYGYAVLQLSQVFPVGGEASMTHPCLPDSPCLCTPRVERYYADCSSQNLTAVPPLPPNITDLDLSSNRIAELKDRSFANLRQLRTLSLSHNSITAISIRAFDGLSNLKVLDLTANKLNMTESVYNPATFRPLVNVTTLLLPGNVATDEYSAQSLEYPDEALGQLHSLQMLSVDGLPNKTFGVGFKQCKIKYLTLSDLYSSCHVVSLFHNTFQNMPGLTHLNLSSCHIQNIQAETFVALKLLENLDLSYNTRLGFRPLRHVFYGLQFTNVTVLNISKLYSTFGLGTEITMQDLEFMKNTKLQEIYANANRLQLVETNALLLFPNTTRLLSVEDNQFTYGEYLQQLGCLENLEEFLGNRQHFPHNPLVDGERGSQIHIANIPFANELDFDRDVLEKHFLDKASRNCQYFNGSEPIFHITLPLNLKFVKFSESAMEYTLDGIFMPENRIEKIDLSGNILNPWIGTILHGKRCKELDLSKNYCSQVSATFFSQGTGLETLKLQRNFLGFAFENDEASEIFRTLSSLKSLDLSLNKINYLPKTIFSSLQKLESLNLSLNSLSSLDVDISQVNKLSNVDLRGNQLMYLPQSIIATITNVARKKTVTVNLLGNPLACTCEHLDFVQWLASSSVVFPNKANYTCFDRDGQPVDMSRLPDLVMKLEKNCPSYGWLIILSTLCISFFLFVVLSGIVYRYRWNLRYLYYMTKKRVHGYEVVPAVDPVDDYRYPAFVSYAGEQLMFIRNEMIVHLEEELQVPLCIHQRDFMAGNAVADNITHAIQSSRKTVVLLTNDFLQSYWCKFELNMARMESIYSRDGRPIILVIMLATDLDLTSLPLELLELINSNSYIEYPDDPQGNVVFWERVKEAIMN